MASSGMQERVCAIREFRPGDEEAFRRLNEEWIVRYFVIEPKDREALADPRKSILDKGGRILLAECAGETVGCCALVKIGPAEFELAKMAVTQAFQGSGIGRRLLAEAIALARSLGTTRLFLETNKRMAAALRLYESMGFRHIPEERVTPSPYARSDVQMELDLV